MAPKGKKKTCRLEQCMVANENYLKGYVDLKNYDVVKAKEIGGPNDGKLVDVDKVFYDGAKRKLAAEQEQRRQEQKEKQEKRKPKKVVRK